MMASRRLPPTFMWEASTADFLKPAAMKHDDSTMSSAGAIEKVLTAIRHVIAGEIFLSDRMKGRLLNQLVGGRIKQGSSSIDSLSDRELEVFRLIGEGRGTRQIAEELRLSVRTVEAYREYIKDKLNLKNGTELVQHAFQYVHSGLAA